jgi:hypothetical protein
MPDSDRLIVTRDAEASLFQFENGFRSIEAFLRYRDALAAVSWGAFSSLS